MKPLLPLTTLLLLSGVLFYLSCKKEYSCENCNQVNTPPIADAGPDYVIVLPVDSIILDGSSSSDADGVISSYAWRKIAGPASFLISEPSLVNPVVKKLTAGLYQVELKITDNDGLSATDTMQIIVNDPLQPNRPPVAIAGGDQQLILPINFSSLDGSASYDADNNLAIYHWTKISGPSSFNIVNIDSSITQVTNMVEGIYQFELLVSDAGGLFSKDSVQIMVNNTIQTTCPFQKTLIGTLYPYRYGFQTAKAGNKIVFAGGWEISQAIGSFPSKKVDIYDILTQKWTSFNLTNHGGQVATIAAGDKIFFAGGNSINPTGDASSVIDIYNTIDNTWITAQLSEARNGISTVVAGNKVLFAGGMTTSGPSSKVDIYDLLTSSWSSSNLIQSSIYGQNAVSLGDKALFQGGTGVDIYNASNYSWSTFGLGRNYFGLSTATSGNKIYFAGGYDGGYSGNNFSDVVHVYDVISNSWSSTKMSKPKAIMTSIGTGAKIFWGGGFDSIWTIGTEDYIRPVNDIEVYDVNTGENSHHFMASETNTISLGIANNQVIFWSGFDDLHIYNTNSDKWTICKTELGWGPKSISIGNIIYVAGPVGAQNNSISVWKLEF